MSLMPALNEVSKESTLITATYFMNLESDASFLYVHEEVCELYRVAQHFLTPEHLHEVMNWTWN